MIRDYPQTILLICLIFGVSIAAYFAFWVGSDEVRGYQLFTRYTARVSFLFFLPIFVLGAINQLSPSGFTRFALGKSRQLGLTFGVAHMVHMGAILMLHDQQNRSFTVDDAAALIIYSLLVLQIITSNDYSMKILGKVWKYLHKIAIYAVFIGFFVTYLGRFQKFGGGIYLSLLILASIAWGARILSFVSKTRLAMSRS